MSTDPSTQPTSTSPAPQKSGGTMRHFLVVFIVTLLIAVGIIWAAGAFKPTPKVVLITSTQDAYWDRVVAGAERAAKQFDLQLSVVRAKGDEPGQSQAVRDALAQSPAGIGISPVDAQAQVPLLQDAAKRTMLITFDADCPPSGRLAFIGTDNYLAGRQCGDVVREALPDGGEMLISVGSVEKDNGRLRRMGLIDNMLGRTFDASRQPEPLDQPVKGGNYTIVGTVIDGADPAKCTQLVAEQLGKHPNLKLIVGLYGYSTPAILDALKQANKLNQVKVVGFDEAEPTLAGIEQGTVAGTLVQDQFNMGYDTVRVLAEKINKLQPIGLGTSGEQFLPCRPITSGEAVQMIRYEKQREGLGGAGGAAPSAAPSSQPSATPATQPSPAA